MFPPTLSSICCKPYVFQLFCIVYSVDAGPLDSTQTKSLEIALFRVYANIFSTTSNGLACGPPPSQCPLGSGEKTSWPDSLWLVSVHKTTASHVAVCKTQNVHYQPRSTASAAPNRSTIKLRTNSDI
jgi:hypothetical protein